MKEHYGKPTKCKYCGKNTEKQRVHNIKNASCDKCKKKNNKLYRVNLASKKYETNKKSTK